MNNILNNKPHTPDVAISKKGKLSNLSSYLPGRSERFYAFATYLAERIPEDITPAEFDLVANIALINLRKGVDPFTGIKIANAATGLHKVAYISLSVLVPDIAAVIFPGISTETNSVSSVVSKLVD